MKDNFNVPTGARYDAIDSAAKKQVMPAQTQALDNKVKASANVARDIDRYDPGPPKEGVGITSMKPAGAGRHRGY